MTKHEQKIKAKHEREALAKANKPVAKKAVVVKKPTPKPKTVKKAVPKKKATLRSSTARKNSAMEELFGYMK